MLPAERRASTGLALIFALRMLGLFLVMPVMALEAGSYPPGSPLGRDAATGGASLAAIGAAMGIYGLTQAVLQLPWGMASDRWGRKRQIAAGLLLFAAGSVAAALARTIEGLILGRALQGAGAISAAVTALLADLTRDTMRTRAMAMVGISIALVFALALVLAPTLNGLIGLAGIFWLMAGLALLAVAVLYLAVPAEPAFTPARAHHRPCIRAGFCRTSFTPARAHHRADWTTVLRDTTLLRLNAGVFILHAVQLAMWMVVPRLLEQAGLPRQHHWQVYLPAIAGAFVLMSCMLFRLERRGLLKQALLAAIALVLLTQLALAATAWRAANGSPVIIWWIGFVLLAFFTGFCMLEAAQPSLVSRHAPAPARGTALGLYNTAQSLGLFAGGAMGGLLAHIAGDGVLFIASAVLVLSWLLLSWRMPVPAPECGTPIDATDSPIYTPEQR